MRVGQGYCIWEKCSDHNPQWNKRQSPKVHVRSIHGNTIFPMKISGLREGRIETSTICRFCDISILEILPPSYLIFAGPLSLSLSTSICRAVERWAMAWVERSVERWVGRRASDRHTSSTVLFLLLSLRGGLRDVQDERQTTKCAVNTSQ